jgi:protein-tyrosine phosphatase
VHCTAGKDRTGVAVALLLTSLGVPMPQVLDDYALTETLLGPLQTATTTVTATAPKTAAVVPVSVSGPAQSQLAQLPEESRRVLWRSVRRYVQAALKSNDREYGSVDD